MNFFKTVVALGAFSIIVGCGNSSNDIDLSSKSKNEKSTTNSSNTTNNFHQEKKDDNNEYNQHGKLPTRTNPDHKGISLF